MKEFKTITSVNTQFGSINIYHPDILNDKPDYRPIVLIHTPFLFMKKIPVPTEEAMVFDYIYAGAETPELVLASTGENHSPAFTLYPGNSNKPLTIIMPDDIRKILDNEYDIISAHPQDIGIEHRTYREIGYAYLSVVVNGGYRKHSVIKSSKKHPIDAEIFMRKAEANGVDRSVFPKHFHFNEVLS